MVNVINAILLITGKVYGLSGGSAELVYTVFRDLKSIDVVFGVLMLGLAAFIIFTRFQLSGYKKRGPLFLYLSYGSNIVVSGIYMLAVKGVIGQSVANSGTSASMFASIVMLIINIIYFNKRKELFVN